jgi:glycosyltransferase involved in cell wall biosynthesis
MEKISKILYTSCFSSLQGGGQRSTLLLIQYLDKSQYAPFLVVPHQGQLSAAVEALGVKTESIFLPRLRSLRLISVFRGLKKIRRILKENNIDLIHVESIREAVYCWLAANGLAVPLIFHSRVSDSCWWIDRIVYNISARIIAVSQSAANRFTHIGKTNKIKVIFNGVELDKFVLSANETTTTNKIFTLGYFGRLDPRKSIETVLTAIKKISLPIKFLIVGDGDPLYRQQLKVLANGSAAEFIGYQSDIISLMSAVDAIVLPSIKGEGLSRSIIEAMAMGKIIIVSDIAVEQEILGDVLREFLFPAGNSDKLAKIITNLINNNDIISQYKLAIRQRAVELFDIKINTKKIEKVYQELL